MSIPIARLAAIVPLYRHAGPLPFKERLAAGVAGTSLFFSGLRRGGFFGIVLAVAGADLIYRGVRGHGHVYELIHTPKRKLLRGSTHEEVAA